MLVVDSLSSLHAISVHANRFEFTLTMLAIQCLANMIGALVGQALIGSPPAKNLPASGKTFSLSGIRTRLLPRAMMGASSLSLRRPTIARSTPCLCRHLFRLRVCCLLTTSVPFRWGHGMRVLGAALIKPAVSFIGAMFCSNQALQYVSYPVQALGKSCKMVPVLAVQRLWFKKMYTLRDYLMVALVTVGIIVFRYKSKGGEVRGCGPLTSLLMSHPCSA